MRRWKLDKGSGEVVLAKWKRGLWARALFPASTLIKTDPPALKVMEPTSAQGGVW
jgi:hypothetical protein